MDGETQKDIQNVNEEIRVSHWGRKTKSSKNTHIKSTFCSGHEIQCDKVKHISSEKSLPDKSKI